MSRQLTHRQLIALSKYLEAHRACIGAERPSYAAVAQQAGRELGFACTIANVRSVAEACEMTWSARRADSAPRWKR